VPAGAPKELKKSAKLLSDGSPSFRSNLHAIGTPASTYVRGDYITIFGHTKRDKAMVANMGSKRQDLPSPARPNLFWFAKSAVGGCDQW
jgi:hypothetical protein